VAVKRYPNYNYYLFADADVIFPRIDEYCQCLIQNCVDNPIKTFRAFNECYDTKMSEMEQCLTCDEIIEKYDKGQLNLTKRNGTTFAGGHFVLSRETYEKIGGWDEQFTGWGREDDFMTHKILIIGHCLLIYSPLKAIHLWHPIKTGLQPKTDELYMKMVSYQRDELQKLVFTDYPKIGNQFKYWG